MEQISKLITDEKDISYDMLKQIHEHVREYETVSDKKEFLKNVGAYEQKLILLNSSHPYEVLCYMEELDLPTTKLVLNKLNYKEISRILALFTTEDKEAFYKTFSDLDLVNQFITYDKRADEYIDDLSVDRKIDLLNSSDSKTVVASSKVFDSISNEDKVQVISNINTTNGYVALSSADSYNTVELANEFNNDNMDKSENNLDSKKATEIEQKEEIKEEQEKSEEDKIELDTEFDARMNYFKANFEKYKESNPELNDIDINDPNFHKLIGVSLLLVISKDFENYKKSNLENRVVPNNLELEEFHQVQEQTENEVIQVLQSQVVSNDLEQSQEVEEIGKTL